MTVPTRFVSWTRQVRPPPRNQLRQERVTRNFRKENPLEENRIPLGMEMPLGRFAVFYKLSS